MRTKKLLLWGGLVFSVLARVPALVGGALATLFIRTGPGTAPVGLRRVLAVWAGSFAGTFAPSVMSLIFMLGEGALGS